MAKKKMKWYDWLIIFILLLFTFIPDPTDVVDAGMPIAEPILAFLYYYIRMKGVKI